MTPPERPGQETVAALTPDEEAKFRESVRLLGDDRDEYALQWSNHAAMRLLATLDAERERRAAEPLRGALDHIRGLASGDGGDQASRLDPHNALATIVIVCDAALEATAPSTPIQHRVVNAAQQCACGRPWTEEHAAEFAPSTPEPALDAARLAQMIVSYADATHRVVVEGGDWREIADEWGRTVAACREYLATLTSEPRAAAPQPGDEG